MDMVDTDIGRAQVCAKGNGVIIEKPRHVEVGVPLSRTGKILVNSSRAFLAESGARETVVSERGVTPP